MKSTDSFGQTAKDKIWFFPVFLTGKKIYTIPGFFMDSDERKNKKTFVLIMQKASARSIPRLQAHLAHY